MDSHDSPGDFAPCLDRVRRGDEAASVELVARLLPMVMRIVHAHRPARQAPEDLAQEVFVRVFGRLDRYVARAGIPFHHWVSRLAVRTCLDVLRSERRRPEVRECDLSDGESGWLDHLVSEGPGNGGGEGAEGWGSPAEARELVERLLGRLGVDDRLVISLLDLEERSVAEVAAMTGWSAVGVRVRAFRARSRLRRVAEELRQEARP